MGMLGRSIVNV